MVFKTNRVSNKKSDKGCWNLKNLIKNKLVTNMNCYIVFVNITYYNFFKVVLHSRFPTKFSKKYVLNKKFSKNIYNQVIKIKHFAFY